LHPILVVVIIDKILQKQSLSSMIFFKKESKVKLYKDWALQNFEKELTNQHALINYKITKEKKLVLKQSSRLNINIRPLSVPKPTQSKRGEVPIVKTKHEQQLMMTNNNRQGQRKSYCTWSSSNNIKVIVLLIFNLK
jgi:hypothetical protein